MDSYTVQRGDTIAKVSRLLQTDWQTLRSQNPDSVGRLKNNGNWFLKEGAEVRVKQDSFASLLDNAVNEQSGKAASAPPPSTPPMAASTSDNNTFFSYTVQPGDTLWNLAVERFHVNLEDLIADNAIADPDVLAVGQQLQVRRHQSQGPREVIASWYGEPFHGRPMANGQVYDMHANTIAHKELPLGTRVELSNPETGEHTLAVVTDRGPYIPGREVDLSYGLAKKLSLVNSGVGTLVMKVL